MALVLDYDSDPAKNSIHNSDEGSEGSLSQDSYFVESDSQSVDSATRRKGEADKRLINADEEVFEHNFQGNGARAAAMRPLSYSSAAINSSLQNPILLPDLPALFHGDCLSNHSTPLEIIGRTSQPDFLRPEATRPVAKPFHKKRAPLTKLSQPQHEQEAKPKEWDIASMAPKLKTDRDASKPSGAVITAAAKRLKPNEEGSSIVTAAQVAMLGGQWQPSTIIGAAPDPHSQIEKRNVPSKSMGVSDFLSKGEGGVLLPRHKQDRKEREKEKRSRGQSSVHGWKSEAEMVLRQQYDS